MPTSPYTHIHRVSQSESQIPKLSVERRGKNTQFKQAEQKSRRHEEKRRNRIKMMERKAKTKN
jgi:hypothetical protein